PQPPTPTLIPYTTLFRSQRIILVRCSNTTLRDTVLVQHSTIHNNHLPRYSHIRGNGLCRPRFQPRIQTDGGPQLVHLHFDGPRRSEEHTSELQSLAYLVC